MMEVGVATAKSTQELNAREQGVPEQGVPKQSEQKQGWQAKLRLGYEMRGGRSILAENRHVGPLRVQMPLYPEGDACCHTCILHPPGGVVGGDALSIDLSVAAGGHALLTTPGATKFYRSGGSKGSQLQRLDVAGNGGILEWFPQDNIIFPGAEAMLSTEINLHSGATFIGWELLCLGLPTRGELFDSGSLQSGIRLQVDGRPRFIDRLRVNNVADLQSPAGLRGYPVCGTFLAMKSGGERTAELISRDLMEEMREILRDALRGAGAGDSAGSDALAGITLQNGILVGRYLGRSTFEGREIFQQLWNRLRPLLVGREACPPRIWMT